MEETRYQRVAREQRERQAAREKNIREEEQRRAQHAKLQRRLNREARREKAWGDWLTNDFNYDNEEPNR